MLNGAPKESRTPNLLIRSQVLYPVELWVRTQLRERQPNQVVPQVQAAFCDTSLASVLGACYAIRMNRFTRVVYPAIVALSLALTLSAPMLAQAFAGVRQALVIVRFNQPRVYFDQQLYSAISKAVAIKPEVMFEVVSYAPSTGDATADLKWQAIAGRNTKTVIASMNNMGVPMERITVSGESQQGLRYDETHVLVH